jgi:hypothetical protein
VIRDRDGDMDRGRFDRDFDRSREREPRPRVTQTAPYITSKRGPKYIGWTFCPHCFFPKVGVAYHGTLSTGQKVFELATHSPGAGLRRPGKPICNGSNGRLESMADGSWRPLK